MQTKRQSPVDKDGIVRYRLGWAFTVAEELRLKRAIRDAALFMESYGKGREPFMVDKSRYINSKE